MTGMSQMFLATSSASASGMIYAQSGLLAITGQVPSVLLPQFVQGTTGSLTIIGQVPVVRTPQSLFAASGALAITGQAASVRVPTIVQGVSGAIVVTGQTATIPVPGVVQLTSGYLAVTGQAATARVPVMVQAASGALSVAGQAATVNVSDHKSATAATGALAVTGQAATALVPVRAQAASGALAITGRTLTAYTTLLAYKSGDAAGTCYHSVAAGSCSVTTNSVTVSVAGGVAPYSYSWGYISGTSATVNSSTSATTTFTRGGTGNNTYNGTYRCTVTDNLGHTAYVDVTVSSTYYYNAPTINSSFVPTSGYTGAGYTVYWSSTDATSVAWANSGASSASGTFGTTSGNASGTIDWTGTIYQTHTATGPGGTAYAYIDITGLGVALSASVYPTTASGMGYEPSATSLAQTNSVTVTPSGGTAPYYYSWALLSGSNIHTISDYASSAPYWESMAYGSSGGDTYTATWRCTVTDSASHSTYVDVTVQTTHWVD